MKEMLYEQALLRLTAYCSRSEKCLDDIRRKMNQWKMAEKDQKKILDYIQEGKWVDETRFCRSFVNDKSKYNRWGVHKIRYELKKKGISDELINDALSQIDEQENHNRLHRLLENKKKTVYGSEEQVKQKLIRYAVSRGFLMRDIEWTLNSLFSVKD
jgi:regulatory protein